MNKNVNTFIDDFGNEIVIIDHGNGEFTSMTKATYEKQQAAAINVPDEL